MRSLWLGLILFCTGCLQTENSSSQDAAYAPDEGSLEFQAARAVLAQGCFNCHDYHTKTEDQLIAAGLVVPGDADISEIYGRLQNSSGSITPKDMPQNASIGAGDVAIIKEWIDSIP